MRPVCGCVCVRTCVFVHVCVYMCVCVYCVWVCVRERERKIEAERSLEGRALPQYCNLYSKTSAPGNTMFASCVRER